MTDPVSAAPETRPSCAHLRVEFRTESFPGGLTRGWWECAYGCGTRFQATLRSAVPEERRAPNDRMEELLIRVAETQMALAVCDADMGRAAFGRADEDEDIPSQSDRDALDEEAEDAINTVVAWNEERAAAVSRPRPEAEERRAGEPRGPERYLMHASQVPDDATIAEQILAAVSDMKRNGSFTNGTALCWSPAELELLAMYAIDAKNKLAKLDPNLRD